MGLWQDARFAVRLLVKDKWFTLVAATALALGIGVNNTVFTFVNAVLIRGLPFDDPDRIMSLGTRDARCLSVDLVSPRCNEEMAGRDGDASLARVHHAADGYRGC